MQLGISVYTGVENDLTFHAIQKAEENGMHIAFSSLQIPEEQKSDLLSRFSEIQTHAENAGIDIFTDVSKDTIHSLNLENIYDLKKFSIKYLRLDAGFSPEEVTALSKEYYIVLNASTVERSLQQVCSNCDKTKLLACHNYYPEPYTGLTLQYISEKNKEIHKYGIRTIAFIPGNNNLRGPIYEGLPTVENHRISKESVLKNILELYKAHTDVVLIGDIDVKDETWHELGNLNRNLIEIPIEKIGEISEYTSVIHHDRTDFSEWMFRSVESRQITGRIIEPFNTVERVRGSVCINNSQFGRYAGELSIAKKDMPADGRVNVVGCISKKSMELLDLIDQNIGIKLMEVR